MDTTVMAMALRERYPLNVGSHKRVPFPACGPQAVVTFFFPARIKAGANRGSQTPDRIQSQMPRSGAATGGKAPQSGVIEVPVDYPQNLKLMQDGHQDFLH